MIKTKIKNLKNHIHGGVLPAMATPILNGGEAINPTAINHLVEMLIGAGVKGLFVGGTTGEGILLNTEVRKALANQVKAAVNNRVPIILHVGTNTTADTLTLAYHAAELGVDAIAAVTPYYYGMSDDALFNYYQTIAQAVPDIPFLGYDIPHMAVNGLTPALVARMAAEIPSFAGVKCSRPDAQVVRALIDAGTAETMLLAGNERIAAGLLALGADGLISGFATAVPEPFVALTRAFQYGDMPEAQRQQRIINRILDQLPAGIRIGAIKQIITQRGINAGTAVPPRTMPSEGWDGWTNIQQLLDTSSIAA